MRALWLVPALALTLTACGASPVEQRRGDVEAVIEAANAGDAAGLRAAVGDLRSTIRAQVASNDLDRAEGERLNAIALRLLENAGLLEAAAPSPAPTVEEEPEPTQEPEPEPTEEPEPEPEPTEAEEPDPEPEPEQTFEIEPFPEESPPAAMSQGGAGTGGTPSPAA